jgi:hypothetical protein
MAPPHTISEARRRLDSRDNALEINTLERSPSLGGAVKGPKMVPGGVEVPLAIRGWHYFSSAKPRGLKREG